MVCRGGNGEWESCVTKDANQSGRGSEMVSVDLNYVAGLDAADSRPPSSLYAADSRPQISLSEYRMGHVEESMQMAAQAIKSKPEGKVRLGGRCQGLRQISIFQTARPQTHRLTEDPAM